MTSKQTKSALRSVPRERSVVSPRPRTEGAATAPIELDDGATVAVRRGAMELRDREGQLLVRYVDGALEISAPAGDITLSAPNGRIALRSGRDVTIEAAGELEHRAGQGVTTIVGDRDEPQLRVGHGETRLTGPRLSVQVEQSDATIGSATLVAGRIATSAAVITQQVEQLELTATRLIERTRDTFRDVAELAQTRVGRMRTLVADTFTLSARRTSLASKEDTSIDGKKVLLG